MTTAQAVSFAGSYQSKWPEMVRNGAIVCTVLSTPFIFVLNLAARETALSVSDLSVVLACVLLAGDLFAGRLRFPFGALCLLSLATIILSLVVNTEHVLVSKGPLGAAAEIPKNLIVWLHFYVLANLVRTRHQFLLVLKSWLIAAVIDALLGIGGSLAYQFAGIESSFSMMFRAQGTLADANLFAAHLVVSFLLAVLYCRLTGKYHLWFIPVSLIFAAGIFFSASRGSTMTFGICLVLLCLVNCSWPVRLAALACLGVLGLLISLAPIEGTGTSNPFFSRLSTTTVSLDDEGAADRKRLWDSAWQEFAESPIFGVGRGNFRPLDEPDITKTGQIHNTYLGLLCEIGVLGFLVLITFLVCYPLRLARWPARIPALRIPTRILLLSFLAVGLCGLTICIENYRGLWVLIATAEAYDRLYLRAIV
ncbi:MAG: O-antigen ligase family protein [Bryobacteraceae bacterium]